VLRERKEEGGGKKRRLYPAGRGTLDSGGNSWRGDLLRRPRIDSRTIMDARTSRENSSHGGQLFKTLIERSSRGGGQESVDPAELVVVRERSGGGDRSPQQIIPDSLTLTGVGVLPGGRPWKRKGKAFYWKEKPERNLRSLKNRRLRFPGWE